MLTAYTGIMALTAWLTDMCLHERTGRNKTGFIPRRFWLPVCAVLCLMPVAGAFLPFRGVRHVLQRFGNIWLGIYLAYGTVLSVFLLASVTVRAVRRTRPERGVRGVFPGAALAVALILCVYGMSHAQHPKTVSYDLAISKKTGQSEPYTVVLAADLHLGVNSRTTLMKKMVDLINNEQPDLVVIAGDIFNSSYEAVRQPEEYARILREIRSKDGIYAVYGNHDVEETLLGGFAASPLSQAFRSREMEDFFEKCGFVTLQDEIVSLPGGIQLAGRIDGEKAGDGTRNRMSAEELLLGADQEKPVLVAEHEPVEYQELSQAGADLVLSGHTHAGQIFPGNLIVPFLNENAWGYVRKHDVDTIVTAGVGYYGPPMRIGTDSEITVIHLTFDP